MSKLVDKCGCKPFGPNLTNTMDCPIHAPSGTTAEPGVRGTAPITNQSLPKEQVDEELNQILMCLEKTVWQDLGESYPVKNQRTLTRMGAITAILNYTERVANKRVVEELEKAKSEHSRYCGVCFKPSFNTGGGFECAEHGYKSIYMSRSEAQQLRSELAGSEPQLAHPNKDNKVQPYKEGQDE